MNPESRATGSAPGSLLRCALFVPAHRPTWVGKAIASGVDSVILDLEDAVPDDSKDEAREQLAAEIDQLVGAGVRAQVRLNGWDTGLTEADVEGALASSGPAESQPALILPKVRHADDLLRLDQLLASIEDRRGWPNCSVLTPLGLETALAMRNAYELARCSERVTFGFLAAGPGGDANREIGYVWSKDGTETLFLRSKWVLDARAAAIEPMIMSWWDVVDLDGLEQDARRNRALGARGQVVIHPSHVPVVQQAFTPSDEEIDHARRLLQAYDQAVAEGRSALLFEGDMVDTAMATTARALLDFSERIAR